MKVLVARPPRINGKIATSCEECCVGTMGLQQPMQLLLVDSLLYRSGYDVKFIDFQIDDFHSFDFSSFDIIISSIGLYKQFYSDIDFLFKIKSEQNLLVVIVNEDYEITSKQIMEKYKFIDYLVRREERELTILKLLENISSPEKVPGLLINSNSLAIIDTGKSLAERNLDFLVPMRTINIAIEKYNIYWVLCAKGCQHSCTFCNYRCTQVRYRNPEHIVSDLSLFDGRQKMIYLYALNIAANKSEVINICSYIEKSSINIRFRTDIRADDLDEDVASALSRAGCKILVIGVEHPNEMIRNTFFKKGIMDIDVINSCKLCEKYEMRASLRFITHLPNEDNFEYYSLYTDLLERIKEEKVHPKKFIRAVTSPLRMPYGTPLFLQYINKEFLLDDYVRGKRKALYYKEDE